MAKFYSKNDVNKESCKGQKIAVLGYGSQGRGQALNLRDSGEDVVIGLRRGGKSWIVAEADGFSPMECDAAVAAADVIAMLVPDMAMPELFEKTVKPNLKEGAMVLFSHGFNIHYGQIKAPEGIDVTMIAPKGPGRLVRTQFEEGKGVPCLIAIHSDATGKAHERALVYADSIGGTRAGVLETTFAEETETDLFGEQAVLCGGATELVVKGWETLVEAGYQPEVAYFECLHELKLIVDLLYEGGITKMLEFISETATYGDLTIGPLVVDEDTREKMRAVLANIRSGGFARDWILENQAGKPQYEALLKEDLSHPIEEIGKELRSRMAWLSEK